jgi:hypothetical protein
MGEIKNVLKGDAKVRLLDCVRRDRDELGAGKYGPKHWADKYTIELHQRVTWSNIKYQARSAGVKIDTGHAAPRTRKRRSEIVLIGLEAIVALAKRCNHHDLREIKAVEEVLDGQKRLPAGEDDQ